MKKNIVVAIDGPAGSGKSTISRIIAERNNFKFITSGIFYRACAFIFKDHDINILKEKDFLSTIYNYDISWKNNTLYINKIDYSIELNANEISNKASLISKKDFVRKYVNNLIRNIANNMSIIMDGRDIGSIVFPNADLKIFLIASILTRAKRRYLELDKKISLIKLIKDIYLRDLNDKKRKIDPLIKSKDAIKINSTKYTIDEIVIKIENIMKQRGLI